jgi:hypothetical protein
LARNIDLLKRIHRIAGNHDKPIMTSLELRQRLELNEGNGQYGRKKNIPDKDQGLAPQVHVGTARLKGSESHRHLH